MAGFRRDGHKYYQLHISIVGKLWTAIIQARHVGGASNKGINFSIQGCRKSGPPKRSV